MHKEETIASVKDLIEAEIGLSGDEQRLVFGEKELADNALVKDLVLRGEGADGKLPTTLILIPVPSTEPKAKLESWTSNAFDDSHWSPPTAATSRCCVCFFHNFLPLPSSFLARFGWWRPGTEHWYQKHKYTFYRFVADRPAVRDANSDFDAGASGVEMTEQGQEQAIQVANHDGARVEVV